ncbi:MAG TPA: NUDIX hydrolase [Thermomicrobiales bacterium]|nr:NUDIX hydrolase [Thermomicrobiales bacterium]
MKLYIDLYGEEHERPAETPVQWRIGGYGVVEREGRLLMVEPVWTTGWTWDLPGGGVRLMPEETILEGIIREVHEETGYRFAPDPATLPHHGDVFFRTLTGRYLRSITFTVRGEVGDEPDPAWRRPEDEIARVGWVDPRTLRREAVHWHHWDALVKLGYVKDDG